jgi:transglutaminase-like putative cysteine protease
VNSTAWGLAYDDNGLLALSHSGNCAEIYSVIIRESEHAVLAKPIERSVTGRIPITNENANPYHLDLYLACPADHAYQQVSHLALDPAPTAMYEDEYGNPWAHFSLRGGAQPLEVTQKFDVLTVSAAQTLDPDYVFRPDDVPGDLLQRFTSETECFDYSHPKVAELERRIPQTTRYLDRLLAIRDTVNNALEIQGPSSLEGRKASYFVDSGVGRCYAHTLTLAALARRGGIPVRAIAGVEFGEGIESTYVMNDESVHTWNEVYMPGIGWVDIDATKDDEKDGHHTFDYVGVYSSRYFITFVGAFDTYAPPKSFARRGWWKTQAWSSLDRQNKAKVTTGPPEVTAVVRLP